MRFACLAALCLIGVATVHAQSADSLTITEDHFRVYTATGEPSSLDAIFAAMQETDVVYVGETHNDPVGHWLEHALFKGAHERYGIATDGQAARPVTLSMEMFQRDVQFILDEYLNGLISERHFQASSRPWQNYETDYRPMVEYAKEHGLTVIAANAPRRYVNRVSREGPQSLDVLSDHAKSFLAPLPYTKASDAYRAKWDALMREAMASMPAAKHDTTKSDDAAAETDESGEEAEAKQAEAPASPSMHSGPSYMLDAQSLWDATMAYGIVEGLMRQPDALVLHMVGAFHVERNVGTPEHVRLYRPGTRSIIVSLRPHDDVTSFDAEQFGGLGDFVILTDASLPRTY